jgi:RES domain-containing protein
MAPETLAPVRWTDRDADARDGTRCASSGNHPRANWTRSRGMRFWRLARQCFATLDGLGAYLNGGRWNRPGLPLVYCSEHLSLAVLEILVHLEVDPDGLPDEYVKIAVDIPRSIKLARIDHLPIDLEDTVGLGSRWFESSATLGLLVPSVVIREERNLLLNPQHRDFPRLKVLDAQAFRFDPRLNPP